MGNKPKPVHLKMTQSEHRRALRMVELSECRSLSELIRHSLQLYDVALQARMQGAESVFVHPETQQMGPVVVASLANVGRSNEG